MNTIVGNFARGLFRAVSLILVAQMLFAAEHNVRDAHDNALMACALIFTCSIGWWTENTK